MNCKRCDGKLEIATTVYLDLDDGEYVGTTGGDMILIRDMSFSHLNDEYRGMPLDLEAHFTVSCSECGHEYPWRLHPIALMDVGMQPIGDAPRTLGKRGGL